MKFSQLIRYIFIFIFIYVFLALMMFFESFIFMVSGFLGVALVILAASAILFCFYEFFEKNRNKFTSCIDEKFVLMVVHKLRTSLTGIKWSLKMLIGGDFGQTTAEQIDILSKMAKKTDAMVSSVDELMDLSRVEDGEHLYNMSITNIEDIIQSVAGDYQNEIKRKNIKYTFEKNGSIFTGVKCDKEAIEAVIQNLLDNAIKYTPVGGIVGVSLGLSDNKTLEIKVFDSGVGIPKQKHNQIFGKFFRAENAIKIAPSGMGLGLFIAKNIVEAHKGKIWFESEENKGATFYVSFPIAFTKNI